MILAQTIESYLNNDLKILREAKILISVNGPEIDFKNKNPLPEGGIIKLFIKLLE